jgi:HlyD family secretion protein
MKKLIIGLIVIMFVGVGAYFYFARAGAAAQPAVAAPAPAVAASNAVVVGGRVVPARSAALSFETGGTVAEVLVHEGDQVQAGQVLARLDQTRLTVALARAEAQVRQAQANYAKLNDGPRLEDVAAAEAQLRQAQAQFRAALDSVTPADLQAAQANLQAAQAVLARLLSGAKNADVRAAQAQLQQAQASLAGQRGQLSAGKTTADLQLDQSADNLIKAQTDYSAAKWNWDHVQSNGTDPLNPTMADPKNPGKTKANKLNETQKQQYQDAFTQAEAALHSAETAVAQARVAAANAHQGELSGAQVAEQQVAAAQANLDRITSSIATDQLAAAKAQLASAQANLGKLRGPQRDNQLAVAQAGVDAAQANLARAKAGPVASELLAAQAQIDSAQADVTTARVDLERAELKSPFAGAVAALDLKLNEHVVPGAAIAQIADTSTWQVETTDLTELSAVRVRAGDTVKLTFDAIPNLVLSGKVLRMKGYGENRQGDIVYKVVVQPDTADAQLRWNMTSTVSITGR